MRNVPRIDQLGGKTIAVRLTSLLALIAASASSVSANPLDGTEQTVSANHVAKCMELNSNQTGIMQWACKPYYDNDNQRFKFVLSGTNYKIVSASTDKCLTAPMGIDGDITAATCTSNSNQLFTVSPQGDSYTFRNVSSNYCVDVRWSDDANGARYVQATCVNASNQKFWLLSAGCPPGTREPYRWPYHAHSVWNTPLGSSATYGSTNHTYATSIRSVNFEFNTTNWSINMYAARTSDPLKTVQIPGGTPLTIHIPAGASASGGGDAEMTIADPDGTKVYEFFVLSQTGGNYTAEIGLNTSFQSLLGTGVATFDTTGTGCPYWSGIRAAGMSDVGGLLRGWEIEAKDIRHALALALTEAQLSTNQIVWPGSCVDNNNTNTGSIPYGQLFAIPPGVNINALGLNDYGKAVAKALQDYGAYVTDRGSNGVLYGDQTISNTISDAVGDDLATLVNAMRPVLNNTFSTNQSTHTAGGGTPRVSLAPAMCMKGNEFGGGP